MTIRSHMISILGLIRPEPLELFDLELKTKIAIFHFVYTLASTNINQSSPNLVKIYMTIRSQMSSILDLIGQKDQNYLPLNLKKKCYIWLCFLSSIYKFYPVITKLGQNTCIHNHKILDEFDYGSNWIRTTGVICP